VRLTLKKTIPALETFSFSVNKIMNPNSTYESGVVRVQIYQSDAVQIVLNEDTKEMTIVTSIPHSVSNANLTSSVTGAGLATTYTLNMVLEHNIPKNGGILVRYPPEVVVNDEIKV
jgi:outer membrane lipopolysaccharide assembly protein LptE/RlpB